MLQHVLLTLSLVVVALLLGASVYESVVMAPNFAHDIPGSIEATRRFLVRRTPAHFFRRLSPIAQVLLLGSAIASWSTAVRWPVVGGLGLLILLDVITFTFHYPRLAILFRDPLPGSPEQLRRAAREWAGGNILRIVLLLTAFLTVLHALLGSTGHGAA